MTQETAEKARDYLAKIAQLDYLLDRLRDEREAKMTGLDYTTPGGQDHMLETLKTEWPILGESFTQYFKAAMDSAIRHTEERLVDYRKKLEEL